MAKRRTQRELEASKIRARIRRRRLMGWPEERLNEPPRSWSTSGPRSVRHAPLVPVPDIERDALVEDALGALRPYERSEIGGTFDSIGRDLVGIYCLAVLAGADPLEAVRVERARYRRDRAWLIYGTSYGDDLRR